MFEEATDLCLIESPGPLDIITQERFQDIEGGRVMADLPDQLKQLAKPLSRLVTVDVPQGQLDQSGQDLALDRRAALDRDVVQYSGTQI